MARAGSALPPSGSGPALRCRALGLLFSVLAFPACETMERMDYFDRFFESQASQRPAVVMAQSRPDLAPAPPPAPAPASGWDLPPGPVVAMEPRPDPLSSSTSWSGSDGGLQPGAVVAMEPRPNPPPPSVSSAALDGSAQPNRDRSARGAAEPRPDPAAADPEARTRSLVRQNPWLTQFWMELTPAQQARVERQLNRGGMVLAAERAEPAAAWDSMGLSDRAKLIFGNGGGQPLERPAPPERRDGSTWARNS